jgi:hypothetical protein
MRLVSVAVVGLMLAGCGLYRETPKDLGGIFNQPTYYAADAPGQPQGPLAGQPIGGAVDKAVLLPGGDYYVATLRERPVDREVTRVFCQAPSPDWATAIAMQQQLNASGNFFQGSQGQFAASGSYAETISAMAGRTSGVIALRDGLYNACQAYANGVIGKDAYALILSQYGYLLVALAGNNSGGGGASSGGGSDKSGSSSSSTTPGVSVAVNNAPAPAATLPSGGANKGSDSPSPSGPSATQIAQLQLQGMSALMVACISKYDHSVNHDPVQPAAGRDLLTFDLCKQLLQTMTTGSNTLLVSVAKQH